MAGARAPAGAGVCSQREDARGEGPGRGHPSRQGGACRRISGPARSPPVWGAATRDPADPGVPLRWSGGGQSLLQFSNDLPATWAFNQFVAAVTLPEGGTIPSEFAPATMDIWPDATIKDYSVELETADCTFIETVALRVLSLKVSGTEVKMPIFPGASDEMPHAPLRKRNTAVVYDFTRTIRYETTLTGIPASVAVVASQSQEGDGWSVATTYAR